MAGAVGAPAIREPAIRPTDAETVFGEILAPPPPPLPQDARRPRSEDFTPRAVERAVLADTLQHPLTILPAAVSAVGGLYMALIGLGPGSFAVTAGGALLAAGAWIWNYFFRGEKLAEQHVARLRERRERLRREELLSLESEWAAAGSEEGAQQARELREAYGKLEDLLASRWAETRGLNVERLQLLAEDTYREGAAILRQALEAHRALFQIDRKKLERELFEWRADLGRLRSRQAGEVSAEALETRIAAHERRLKLCVEQAQTVERLLAESEVLESALETTYLEAVELQSPEVFFSRGQAAVELERAVAAARRVEDRLRQMGRPPAEDDVYLAAGERQKS